MIRTALLGLLLAACGSSTTTTTDAGGEDLITTPSTDGSSTDGATKVGDAGTNADALVAQTNLDAAGNDEGFVTTCISETTNIAQVICAANQFLATLTTAELAEVNLAFSNSDARTEWSNLPGVTRAGVKVSAFTNTQSRAAAVTLMSFVLTQQGQVDLVGVMNADDYLAAQQSGGGGGPGGAYSSGNYTVAIFGTPATTGSWEIMFGGHHMAYNITYVDGVAYPVPNHLGVEPKYTFQENGGTFAPLADEGAAMQALFASLSTTDLSAAYLTGQTFGDVVIGPVEYGTGSEAAVVTKYPATPLGVKVSELSTAQQALVTTAIGAWVNDYAPEISSTLLADYTAASAYETTYIAWGGTQSSGPDVDVAGTYFRIDGPRVWIEVACQSGVVIQGLTHYHTIYRDKLYDYGATLSP